MIEVGEFPHLANKYEVRGVPKTVINEAQSIDGALPERGFLEGISRAIRPKEWSG
jgi:hypothetical protein